MQKTGKDLWGSGEFLFLSVSITQLENQLLLQPYKLDIMVILISQIRRPKLRVIMGPNHTARKEVPQTYPKIIGRGKGCGIFPVLLPQVGAKTCLKCSFWKSWERNISNIGSKRKLVFHPSTAAINLGCHCKDSLKDNILAMVQLNTWSFSFSYPEGKGRMALNELGLLG